MALLLEWTSQLFASKGLPICAFLVLVPSTSIPKYSIPLHKIIIFPLYIQSPHRKFLWIFSKQILTILGIKNEDIQEIENWKGCFWNWIYMLHFLFKWEGQILWSNMIELLYFGISRKAMDTPFPMLILPRENHEGINIQTLICREGVQEQGGNCCGTCNKLSFFISISDICIWNLMILHISTLILNVLACEIVGAVCLTEYCWALYQNFQLTSSVSCRKWDSGHYWKAFFFLQMH